VDFYYQFIDKALVDPILDLRWAEFLALRPRPKWPTVGGTKGFIKYIFDTEPEPERVRWILENKTLRWTLYHCELAFFFLDSIIYEVPTVCRGCPTFWPESIEEAIVLLAAAVNAYLEGRLNPRSLKSVLLLISVFPDEWLNLTRKELAAVMEVFRKAKRRPIYGSLSIERIEHESSWLTETDTTLFMNFILRAVVENWPAPRLKKSVREMVSFGVTRRRIVSIKDITLAKGLLSIWTKHHFVNPFLVQLWEY
jgi:hypothetical protein